MDPELGPNLVFAPHSLTGWGGEGDGVSVMSLLKAPVTSEGACSSQ